MVRSMKKPCYPHFADGAINWNKYRGEVFLLQLGFPLALTKSPNGVRIYFLRIVLITIYSLVRW